MRQTPNARTRWPWTTLNTGAAGCARVGEGRRVMGDVPLCREGRQQSARKHNRAEAELRAAVAGSGRPHPSWGWLTRTAPRTPDICSAERIPLRQVRLRFAKARLVSVQMSYAARRTPGAGVFARSSRSCIATRTSSRFHNGSQRTTALEARGAPETESRKEVFASLACWFVRPRHQTPTGKQALSHDRATSPATRRYAQPEGTRNTRKRSGAIFF